MSLFGGYRQAQLEEIDYARFIVGLHPTRPPIRLEIYSASSERPIVVKRAIFKDKDVEPVVKWFGPKIHAHVGEQGKQS